MGSDFSKAYGFTPGFSYRREPFGGILYHYEGVKPDPRVTFVDNVFLIDLLDRVGDEPLEDLVTRIAGHFALDAKEIAAIRGFLADLIVRGALVERANLCSACGVQSK